VSILLLVILVLAFLLIIAEIILIPGVTWFGLAGAVLAVIGIYLSFRDLGNTAGYSVLGGFVVFISLAIYIGYKSNIWRKFALFQTIEAKVNDEQYLLMQLKIGDEGKTISELKPVGKAAFGNRLIEVQSQGNFVDENVSVKIIKIENTKIFVRILS
jgi:membrane-bound ClpP family serine protease